MEFHKRGMFFPFLVPYLAVTYPITVFDKCLYQHILRNVLLNLNNFSNTKCLCMFKVKIVFHDTSILSDETEPMFLRTVYPKIYARGKTSHRV